MTWTTCSPRNRSCVCLARQVGPAEIILDVFSGLPRVAAQQNFAVIGGQCAEGAPHSRRLFEHRIEHRRKITGRRIDDLENLGGGGLLLQCLTRLGDQPRILHRDDRLGGEVLQQRDLLFGEGRTSLRYTWIAPSTA